MKHFTSKGMASDVSRFLRYVKKGRILDAGCGPGRCMKQIISRGYDAVGIDFSKGMIKEAKKCVPKGDFRLMDMRKLKFTKNSFDGILCQAAFLHIEKKDAGSVIREFQRVLKPGGILSISVKKGIGEALENDQGGPRFFAYYEKEELSDLVRKHKFRMLESRYRHLADEWILVIAQKVK